MQALIRLKSVSYTHLDVYKRQSLKGSELAFAQRLMEDIQNAGYYNVENVEDLEFVFGEITDSIIETLNKNHYVKQHKKYYQSEEYALEIINNYPENLMQIYEETLQDNSVLSYDTLDLSLIHI